MIFTNRISKMLGWVAIIGLVALFLVHYYTTTPLVGQYWLAGAIVFLNILAMAIDILTAKQSKTDVLEKYSVGKVPAKDEREELEKYRAAYMAYLVLRAMITAGLIINGTLVIIGVTSPYTTVLFVILILTGDTVYIRNLQQHDVEAFSELQELKNRGSK